jgi:hypothetical protein
MTLNPNGVISGTPVWPRPPVPSTSQTYTLQVRATDFLGKSATANFTLLIAPPQGPEILTDCPLPSGLEKYPYPVVQLKARYGKEPYRWPKPAGLPPGLVWNERGYISGTPTTRGTYPITLQVIDANGLSANKSCEIVIRPAPEIVVKPLFLCARVGDTRCEEIEALGGDPPFTWAATGLPPGLTIQSSNSTKAKICGNFTQNGTFTINVTATDTVGRKDTELFPAIIVKPALEITTTSPLPFGIKGNSYPRKTGTPTVTINATGGWPPYTWSWQNLLPEPPPGLTLNKSTGAITGVPTKIGNYTFTIRVQDSCTTPGKWVDRDFNIKVYDPLEIKDSRILQCLTINTTISPPFCLTATGGLPGYEWSIESGNLPAGLTLSSNGCITGTITEGGNFTVTIKVKDQNEIETTKSFSFFVYNELIITSACPLAFGTNATTYSANLTASGGNPPYSWSLVSPSTLPTGISLNATTGKISGKPLFSGNFSFTYKVLDACGNTATKNCTISIYEPLKIPTTEFFSCVWVGDDAECFQVQATGGLPAYTWEAVGLPPTLTINATSGKICGNFTQAGNFTSTIRITDQNGTFLEKTFTTEVNAPLEITTACPLPGGQIEEAYNTTLTATGGNPPYTWQILPQIYVADFNNNKIRKFYEGGIVTTYAGNGINASIDGNLTNSSFNNPYGMGFDPNGNLYIADRSKIRKIDSYGNVTTLNGTFYNPEDMVSDDAGNVYVADAGNGVITKIDTSGNILNIAGQSGGAGFVNGNGSTARFYSLQGICWDLVGNMIVTDMGNHAIRKITTTGNVTTIAGNGPESAGFVDGSVQNSKFDGPHDVKVHQDGTIYVLDHSNGCIRKISSNGTVSTLGNRLNLITPYCLSVDKNGFVYVSDGATNHNISKISPNGNVTIIAGSGNGSLENVSPLQAKFSSPRGVEINPYEDLPLGLTLNSTTGMISGAPRAYGLYNITYQVTDSCGNKVISECDLFINDPCQDALPLTFSTNSPLPPWIVGNYNELFISVSGGIPPYTYEVDETTLPPGVSTDGNGKIFGIPTQIASLNEPAKVYWVQWTKPSSYPFSYTAYPSWAKYAKSTNGKIEIPGGGVIDVSLNGEILNQSQFNLNDGGIVWNTTYVHSHAPAIGTYTNQYTPLLPSNSDRISITGAGVPKQIISFSRSVSNIVMNIRSLGGSTDEATYKFENNFTLTGSDSVPYNITKNGSLISGKEGYGQIIFPGNFDEITWSMLDPEAWNDWNIGVTSFYNNEVKIKVRDSCGKEITGNFTLEVKSTP